MRTLQAFTNEKLAQSRFSSAVEQAYAAACGATKARGVLTAVVIFLVFASIVVVLWVGAQDVLAGTITAGRLGQFVLYAVFAAGGLSELSQVWGEIAQASGAAEHLFEILNVEPQIKAPPRPMALPKPARGEVEFRDVSFAYPGRPNVPVLDRVSFRVMPGEKLALVGPSGAGKSTIFQLILRFYDPLSGSIGFDGVRLTDVDPAALRAQIALGATGRCGFRHERAGEHSVWAARRYRCRDREGGRGRTRFRVHSTPAAGIRYAGRRARRHIIRRTAPAHRDCTRNFAQSAALAA